MRVDEHLLGGFGILQHDQAQVGQGHLQGIDQPHGDDFMTPGQHGERRLPARGADEVGDDEHHRAPPGNQACLLQQVAQAGLARAGRRRGVHAVEHVQQLAPARTRRDHHRSLAGGAAIEHGADAVAVARQQQRHHRGEVGEQVALAHRARAELDRAAQVQHEPRGDVAVFLELAHVRGLQPRGHVPVDMAHVVAGAVFAQVGQVEPEAAEQRAVVALQQPVEAAHHGPFEPAQQRLGLL
ncbi:hypothetical protein D3C72_1223720 [compost metagenome]